MTGPAVTRRSLLKAAGPLLLPAAGAVPLAAAGCAARDDPVEIFVMWSGGELAAFLDTMDEFERETGRRTRTVPVGEQVRELLRARFNANNPPDLAIVPLPGLIREYARNGRVMELDPAAGRHIPASLNQTVTVDGRLYGLWVKAAHKSLFWYRPSALAGAGPPATWGELVSLLRRAAGAGQPPLSIGAADGWVLTDWFENVLAGLDGGATYQRLAAGEDLWASDVVTAALVRLAEVWSIPGVFPYGPRRALLTQFEESVFEVFAECRSAVVFEGDFVDAVIGRLNAAGRLCEEPETFRVPPVTGGPPPLVVGGDVAARMNDSEGSRELVEWLARPESLAGWIKRAGFLSPNRTVPIGTYPPGRGQQLAAELRAADQFLFDLSDQLGGRLSAGQGRGMTKILTEFFQSVATPGGHPDRPVRAAQRRLVDAARGD